MEPELETERGDRLLAWEPTHADAVFAAFDDPAMATQISEPLTDVNAARAWIDERTAAWARDMERSWAVVDDSTLVGSVTVSSFDRRHDTAWISYWTVEAARGAGVASSALRAVATWAFDELGLFRLELAHRTNNPASCGVATGAGFVVEGVARQRLRYGDERFDVETHARLTTDPVPPRR